MLVHRIIRMALQSNENWLHLSFNIDLESSISVLFPIRVVAKLEFCCRNWWQCTGYELL